MAKKGDRGPKALARENRERGVCGLCGRQGALTKTHVPPRCAGNRGSVKRFTIVSDPQHRAGATAKRIGGIHFYGLCAACNGVVQAAWDPAYCEMAKSLWAIATDSPLHLPKKLRLPSVEIQPGAVARCVLVGCFALNPALRNVSPELAAKLLAGSPNIELPGDLSLQLALTRGPFARVTGSIGGFHVFRPKVGGRNVGIMSMAQIYFPPLAWQLADRAESVLLDQEGWSDVSGWLSLSPDEKVVLSDLVPELPLVVHPLRSPGAPADWTELLSGEACFIVESDNAVSSEWLV